MISVEMRAVNGQPAFFVNGKKQVPMLLFTNTEIDNGSRRDICAKEIRLASEHGIHLHSVCCHMPVHQLPGERDFSVAIESMKTVLENDPQAMIFLRINLSLYGKDAEAWNAQHPGDSMRFTLHPELSDMILCEDGTYRESTATATSITSEEWLAAAIDTFRELHEWIEGHSEYNEHLLGYHVAAGECGEWFYDAVRDCGLDVSEANRKAFQKWLREKYSSDIRQLTEAWCVSSNRYTDFSQVDIPTDIPGNDRSHPAERTLFLNPEDRRYIDYSDYASDCVADRIIQLTKTVREITKGKKLIVVFYGYYYELYDARTGHYRLNRLLDCPYIDGFASPVSYLDRNQGGTGAVMGPVDSVALHGKMWFVESDLRTGLTIRSHGPNDYENWLNKPVECLEHLLQVYRREAAQMIARGMGCWFMDLPAQGWLYHPMIWECIREQRDFYHQMTEEAQPLRPDVAVVLDEKAMSLVAHAEACGNKLLHTFQQTIYRAGVKFGWYTVEDVENGLVPSAKVFYFLNPFYITEERCEKLRNVAQKQNAALVFIHGFGQTEDSCVERLTGMKISKYTCSMENLTMTASFMPEGKSFMPCSEDGVSEQWANPASWVEPKEGVRPLAVYTRGHVRGRVGAAMCQVDGVTSVFVGALQLTADGIREICRMCGVHIYSEGQDALMIGNRILAVHADASTGIRKISLKGEAVLTGEGYTPLSVNQKTYWETNMDAFETKVWICYDDDDI